MQKVSWLHDGLMASEGWADSICFVNSSTLPNPAISLVTAPPAPKWSPSTHHRALSRAGVREHELLRRQLLTRNAFNLSFIMFTFNLHIFGFTLNWTNIPLRFINFPSAAALARFSYRMRWHDDEWGGWRGWMEGKFVILFGSFCLFVISRHMSCHTPCSCQLISICLLRDYTTLQGLSLLTACRTEKLSFACIKSPHANLFVSTKREGLTQSNPPFAPC